MKERVGRPSGPRLFAGARGVAALFPGTRGDAAVRLDRPGVLYLPDPLEACGEGRARLVLPHAEGVLRVSVRTAPWQDEGDQGEPLAVAEVVDDAGRPPRGPSPLGPWNERLPAPRRRAPRPRREGVRPVRRPLHRDLAHGDAARGGLGPGRRRAGRRAAPPPRAARAARHGCRLGRARSPPRGARIEVSRPGHRGSERRSREARPRRRRRAGGAGGREGGPDPPRRPPLPTCARRSWSGFGQRVESGAPAWLRRVAARALLSASQPTLRRGLSRRSPRPSRPVRTVRTCPCPTRPSRSSSPSSSRPSTGRASTGSSGSGPRSPKGSSPGTWRRRSPAASTSCGSTRRPAASPGRCSTAPPAPRPPRGSSPWPASPRPQRRPRRPRPALARDEEEPGRAADTRGGLAATLLTAQGSPDAGLRASALAVGPLVGLPIDPARFRADVLKRPHLAAFGFLGLVGDRSLPPRTWMGLFTELFAGARAASRDPSACALSGSPVLQADGESSLDRYCNLFAIVHFAALDLGDDDDPAFISRERIGLLGDFARSASAPPELRLDLKLGRALRGTASEEDLVEILGERELAPVFRRVVLGKLVAGSARLSAYLERELSSGRLAPSERGVWLDALARLDAAAGDRVAAEAWTRGLVPLDVDDGDAGAFARALDPERVRASEPLRAALRRARDLPAVSLEAASALARAADPGSAASLVKALLETCPACPVSRRSRRALRAARRGGARGARPPGRGDAAVRRFPSRGPLRAGHRRARRSWDAPTSRPPSPVGASPSRSCRRSWPTASTRSPSCWRPFRTGGATGHA